MGYLWRGVSLGSSLAGRAGNPQPVDLCPKPVLVAQHPQLRAGNALAVAAAFPRGPALPLWPLGVEVGTPPPR